MKNKILATSIVYLVLVFYGCNRDSDTLNNARRSYKLGRYNETIKYIDKISINRLNSESYTLKGLSYYRLTNYSEAIKDFWESYKLNESDTVAILGLARCYEGLHKWNQAVHFYSLSLKIDKHNLLALNSRGVCLLNEEEIDKAWSDFNGSIKENSDFYLGYNNCGLVNEKTGRYKKAIDYYTLAISKFKFDDKVFFNKGVSYLYKNMPDSALQNFIIATNLNPKSGIYFLNRGMAHYFLKNYNLACEDWTKARSLNNSEANNYLLKFCNK